MTRFARAHGSKASNERQPEEATSWNVLKQQLLEQQAGSKQKVEEASKPTRQPFVFEKIKSETTEWAEFEETPLPKHKKPAKKKVKLELSDKKLVDILSLDEQHSSKSKLEKKLAKRLKKIKGQEVKNLHSDVPEDLGQVVTIAKPQVKLSKREKRKNKLKVLEKSIETVNPNSTDTHCVELKTSALVDGCECELTKKQLKRKWNMLKKQQDDGFVLKHPPKEDKKKKPCVELKTSASVDDSEHGLTKGQLIRKWNMLREQQEDGFVWKRPWKEDKKMKRMHLQAKPLEKKNDEEGEPKPSNRLKDKRRSQLKKQLGSTLSNVPTNEQVETTDQTQSHSKSNNQAQSKRQKRNLKKLGDPTKVRDRKRRKPCVQSTTMFINGQEIEVTMLDGFPIRKQDADRLNELRKQMIANGIPPNEIKETMKLERRNAEKALSRERRKVCFHCRKGGHNLSDCPELLEGSNQDAAGSGICFKCGSTEHTHFQCRVVRGPEFRFAKCFICQEQGHISRQCPDNPRGLYPKGGGCKVCGDVTHLKKDCPDLHEKKEQNAITLDTARSDRLEALDEDLKMEDHEPPVSAPKEKIVKF